MHATDVRDLMDSALETGELPDALRQQLRESPAVAAEWDRQRAVHALLAASPSVDPPLDFSRRVMQRIEQEGRRQADWRGRLMHVALLLAGTLGAAWSAATLSHQWQLADLWPLAWDSGVAALHTAAVVAEGFALTYDMASLSWLVASVAAGLVAMAWFGVLVLPRTRRAGNGA